MGYQDLVSERSESKILDLGIAFKFQDLVYQDSERLRSQP